MKKVNNNLNLSKKSMNSTNINQKPSFQRKNKPDIKKSTKSSSCCMKNK